MFPDSGTTEEDWPDIDVDSDTEEGAAAIELVEAALHVSIERSSHQQNQHQINGLSYALVEKAREHQDQLTQEERQLLLASGGLVGKTLSYPDSLTVEEMHEILLRPPSGGVRANFQSATGGSLSTPNELYAKLKDAMDHHQLHTLLSKDEIVLVAQSFHTTTYDSGSELRLISVLGGA